MHITIERTALLGALTHAQSVVEKRTTIPILANVMLDAGGDRLSLTATDMDLTLEEVVAASCHKDGIITLEAHIFYEVIKKLPDGVQVELRLDEDSGQCIVSAGASEFRLPTLPAEDFPAIRNTDLPEPMQIDVSVVRELIERTRFAISMEETRYYLNGIFLLTYEDEQGKKGLRAVATDGHRLSKCDIEVSTLQDSISGVIVPRKAVLEIHKAIEGMEGALGLAVSQTRIQMQVGDMCMTSKLIDGTFPDYNRVIPKKNPHALSLDPKAFSKAVDRVTVVSSERSKGVRLNLEEGSEMQMQSSSTDRGLAQEKLSVSYEAPPIQIGFNARYLGDVLEQLSGPEVTFWLVDSSSPVIVEEQSQINDTFASALTFVLMPMRV